MSSATTLIVQALHHDALLWFRWESRTGSLSRPQADFLRFCKSSGLFCLQHGLLALFYAAQHFCPNSPNRIRAGGPSERATSPCFLRVSSWERFQQLSFQLKKRHLVIKIDGVSRKLLKVVSL